MLKYIRDCEGFYLNYRVLECNNTAASAAFFACSTNGAGLLKKDIFFFKRIIISNKPYTNAGIENSRNIGGMRYEDQ
jgi:hypothetical protein